MTVVPCTIKRRELLQRDPPVHWPTIINAIRRQGYNTADICFILNVPRGTLWRWECCGSEPNFDDGRALLKLHFTACKPVATAAPNPMT